MEAEATQQGMDTHSYALAVLTHQPTTSGRLVEDEAAELPRPGSMSPSEIVAYWEREGILRPRPDLPDSPAYARQLREQAQIR